MAHARVRDLRRSRLLVCWMSAAGLVVTASGCAAGHTTLGTSTGTCFLALPTASAAVGGVGKLVGVKSFKPSALIAELTKRVEQMAPGASPYAPFGDTTTSPYAPFGDTTTSPSTSPSSSPGASGPSVGQARARRAVKEIADQLAVFGRSQVCAVEYEGTYLPGSVAHAVDPEGSGHYAIVVLPARGGQPTVSVVLRKLPFTLRHFF